jgi:hypothetical protein
MRIRHVHSCCACFSNQTAARLLAAISIFASISAILNFIRVRLDHVYKDKSIAFFKNLAKVKDETQLRKMLLYLDVILLIISIIRLIIAPMLLYASYNRKAKFVWLYVKMDGLMICILSIIGVTLLIFSYATLGLGISLFLLLLLGMLALELYFLVVMYSYYLDLERETRHWDRRSSAKDIEGIPVSPSKSGASHETRTDVEDGSPTSSSSAKNVPSQLNRRSRRKKHSRRGHIPNTRSSTSSAPISRHSVEVDSAHSSIHDASSLSSKSLASTKATRKGISKKRIKLTSVHVKHR